MTPGIIKKLYHTTPVGLTDEDKQEVYPITATSAVYSAPGESSFPNMSLDNILDALNEGYLYLGKASPSTNPGTYNHKVFYLASEPGTYSYFDGITVSGLTVLKTDGNSWSADAFNITGGGGGGLTTAYIGTTMVQETPAPQQLSGISQLNLTSGARIYFGETAYIELNQYGFHFSEGIYSGYFVAAGGIGSGGGGGGGGSYTPGNGINIVNDEISVKIGTGLSFDASGNLIATGGGSYVLPIASASTLGGIKVGSGLSIDSSGVLSATGGTEGTVTSITLNSGTGIAVSDSGSAITTSGSRTISINSSYRNMISHGDTAYSWGNHAAAGYADASVVNAALAEKQNVISDLETIRSNASRGNTAYGWGNHALAGYAMAADLASLNTRVISIEDWFEIVTVSGQEALHAKNSRAIYSDSWIAAGGVGEGGGGGGTYVQWGTKSGNTRPLTVEGTTEILLLDGALSGYATQSWVGRQGYITSQALNTALAGYATNLALEGKQDKYPFTITGTSNATYALGNFVTIDGAQTITGAKTFSANLSVGGTVNVNGIESINQNNESNAYFNLGAASTKAFNAYGTVVNLRVYDSGSQVNIFSVQNNKIVCGSSIIPNYMTGLNLGGSSDNQRWGTIYGVNENLSGDILLSTTSHIDIGPLRIEYDATNKALHITKKDSNDTNTYGLYADGTLAAGGIAQP